MTTADLLNDKIKIDNIEGSLDTILELAKEDVAKILRKSGRSISFNFFEIYKEAERYTKRTIKKKTKSFRKVMEQKDPRKIIMWIVKRQANNVVNLATDQRYKGYAKTEFVDLQDWNIHFDEKEKIEMEMEIEKIRKNKSKKEKIKAIKKAWRECLFDDEFDSDILDYLCKIFDVKKEEVFPKQNIKIKVHKTKNKNKQLQFIV